jgi:hypothetical protein
MAVERPPVAALQPSTPVAAQESESSFDQRWAAWEAKGAAHDRAFRRKLAVAAPIVIVLVAVIVSALLR